MKKNGLHIALCIWIAGLFNSCTDQISCTPETHLQVGVTTQVPETKDLITGTRLPDGSTIGVFAVEPGLLTYNGMLYNNIPYTAIGSGESQQWSLNDDVLLNDTHGYGYAYYPYNSDVKRPTDIPLNAGQRQDILYSDPAYAPTVHAKSPTAHFVMKHALCLIRLSLTSGSYSGTGQVPYVWAQSEALGTLGSINLTDGLITLSNPGHIISHEPGISLLSAEAQTVDLYAVPGSEPAPLHLGCNVDDHHVGVTIPDFEPQAGYIYTFNLQVENDASCSLSGTQIDCWGFDHLNRPVIQVGEHVVTLAGDLSNLAFNASVSKADLKLNVRPITQPYYYDCKVSGTGTSYRDLDTNTQVSKYTISGIGSDLTLTFHGSSTVSFGWEVLEGRWEDNYRSLFKAVNPQDGHQWRILSPSPGSSHRLRCSFSGCSKITFYTYDTGEQGYDFLRIGALDTPCTPDDYRYSLQGLTGISKYFSYETDGGSHYVEFCLATNETYTQASGEARVCISSFEQ